MRPTLEARGLKANLLQYLSTTYALTDEGTRQALEAFLGDDASGMFRGPFLRIRTPFAKADDTWRDYVDWAPEGFDPYAHQAIAFRRLSSYQHHPEPTLVTTGTGSGKTESFLLPVLDHCRRERGGGRQGIKAILIYPTNALATDQAIRTNKLLGENSQELRRVSAGLYIGESSARGYERVLTKRSDMRLLPPDILITNYKMLDRLLQFGDDAPLWRDADIRYVVVDEFHSYDGAQGTDVAMLLRRLAAAVGSPEAGNPLGGICPVATSATLVSVTDTGPGNRDLLKVASRVFGVTFPPDAIIGEDRQTVEQFIPATELDAGLPLPDPEELWKLADPGRHPEALARLKQLVTGEEAPDDFRLGALLRRHILTKAVMSALADEVKTSGEVMDAMWRAGAYSWGKEIAQRPQLAAEALARFVALLSVARDPDSTPDQPRPLVHVEVHQWARAVSRLLRGVLPWPQAEFRWDAADTFDANGVDGTRTAPVTTLTSGQRANVFLPAVYCRECGRSGWAVFSPESDDQQAEFDASRIRRASTTQDKIRVRNLIAATDAEAMAWAPGDTSGPGGALMVLDCVRGRLRLPDRARDFDADSGQPALTARDSAFVLVNLSVVANTAAKGDWCPACGEHNAIRYLGTGPAALAAASITQMFTGSELDPLQNERKTLMFNDSVQDAAHRAGFVANRSYTFSLRALLTSYLDESEPVALNDLIATIVEKTTDPKTLAAVVPPDLHDHQGVQRLLSGAGRGGDLRTWRLIGERLAFATMMEFGFRSRQGRTLELTRTAAAQVRIPDATVGARLVRDAHLGVRGPSPQEQSDASYLAFLRIFLERLRCRGAINHRWLKGYLSETGTSRFFIWGRRPDGMPAFPKGVAAPLFLLDKPKAGTEFDVATGRLAWHELWARRCLKVTREQAPEFWLVLLPRLVDAGILSVQTAKDGAEHIHGLQPAAVSARKLTDEQVNIAYVRCNVCFWEQTVHPLLLSQWHNQPCPSYRCTKGWLIAGDRSAADDVHQRDRDYREDYYRRLYRDAGTYQVITAEHTAMLTRREREKVELAFREGGSFNAPNVLACTPTLELGIDIGDLSAVVLASLPPTPASYAQRVGRAGRRTGNAFLLTIPARHRDLYFLEQPKEMIAGRIVPPGCHLSAVAILRRQYLAYLLDLAARGRLVPEDGRALRPLPRKAPSLFGVSGYLTDLLELALAQSGRLADAFLALFPDGVTDQAANELREYARDGLGDVFAAAEREWHVRRETLLARLQEIHQAHAELSDADKDEAQQKAELDAERRVTGDRIRQLGDADALNTLTELGLLPNYGLIDSVTTLEATLYWQSGENADGKAFYQTTMRSYDRPRRFAISELAPGNTFYVNGYRHEISGLEIGTADRRTWLDWRICPACGYVRTDDAAADRSSCPRCGSPRIADDGSCLFRVVEPLLVASRDKREDARIRDDRDERDPHFYEVVTAVDMPAETIEQAWRHTGEKVVFGVDFSRRTMVRTFNLGPARFDIPPSADFAGSLVRVSPFHVCTGCGAATADGKPVFDHDTDALTSSAARNPRLKHHRPWCPLRRGMTSSTEQVPVLLAHQLETEAIRILLPAATVLVKEKVHSFRAALRLGVDQNFGGDPSHLDTTIASMPDRTSGLTRWYLVLFDGLPGGTGYLHRFTDPEELRDTLKAARSVLLACQCAGEGRKACHRCLHRYTPERFQGDVSRREAIDLIDSLLYDSRGQEAWPVERVRSTEIIGLEGQLESDLEVRFLHALRDWAARSTDAVFEDSGSTGQLRFASADGAVHWRVTAQQQLDSTRPDFTFTRADGPAQTVHVYLDGRRWHASREHNDLAGDAARRTRLRAEGHPVFQLTWDDLDLFESRPTTADQVWPPYPAGAQDKAKAAYEQYGGDRARLSEAIFANPIETLLAYLRRPEPEVWNRRARALVTGVLAAPGVRQVGAAGQRSELTQLLRAALRDEPFLSAGSGPILVFRFDGLVVALDTADPERLGWTALAVLDDDIAVVGTGEHRRLWRTWLQWTNLLQFLSRAGGDGVQLTTSQVDGYPLEILAVCGGLGELDSLTGVSAAAPPASKTDLAGQAGGDPRWDSEVLLYLDEGEPELATLAAELVRHGRLAPIFTYELGSSGWIADFAWPEERVAVVAAQADDDDDGVEAQRRDAAYQAARWTVRTAAEWLSHLDSLVALLPGIEGADS
jgi:replicative superfamily II helicase